MEQKIDRVIFEYDKTFKVYYYSQDTELL